MPSRCERRRTFGRPELSEPAGIEHSQKLNNKPVNSSKLSAVIPRTTVKTLALTEVLGGRSSIRGRVLVRTFLLSLPLSYISIAVSPIHDDEPRALRFPTLSFTRGVRESPAQTIPEACLALKRLRNRHVESDQDFSRLLFGRPRFGKCVRQITAR